MLEALLQQLISDMEMDGIPLKNERGSYPLRISPEMQIDIQALDPGMLFYAPIGPINPLKKEELLIYLMKANFLGQGTGEGVIGLDHEEKSLTLSLIVPNDIPYKAFKEDIEEFANYVDFWKAELARLKKDAEES